MNATTQSSNGRSDYDLLIVGSGGAGMAAALRASEVGATAAIVESGVIGGTCVNIGCIPSKYLIEAAHRFHLARTGVPGISACEPQLAWRQVIEQKRQIVETLRRERYIDVIAAHEGITLLKGTAELMGEGRVRVDGRELRARKIIIATGTRPALPPIPGLADVDTLNSTTVMELENVPSSMIVIGGGAVGLELGQAFSRFGARVTVIEALEQILPAEDAQVAEALTDALRREGLEIYSGARVSRVTQAKHGYDVEIMDGGGAHNLHAEKLLVATGRRPNTEHLGLALAGVSVNDSGFIEVDEFMRTSNPDVFAAGDVTGGPGFVYVAALAGGIAAQAALAELSDEEPLRIELAATPRVVFTDPQVAAVGLTEAEARAAGHSVKTTAMPATYMPRAIVSGRTEGIIKLVADAESDRLLGAHIVSPNAGDVISEAVLVLRYGLTVQQLVASLHSYLTWSEGLKLAAQTFTKDVAKLSCCA